MHILFQFNICFSKEIRIHQMMLIIINNLWIIMAISLSSHKATLDLCCLLLSYFSQPILSVFCSLSQLGLLPACSFSISVTNSSIFY